MCSEEHERYMRMALRQAEQAAEEEEVPVGAILVHNNRVIGKAHNQVELLKDATAHAEMIAITQGASAIGDWRLTETILYVTKEPCPMCAGAILLSRVPLLVYGAPDPDRGGLSIITNNCDILSGVLEDECRNLLQGFFQALRKTSKGDQLE